jgi:two-component system sensor histidine kinase BaeS
MFKALRTRLILSHVLPLLVMVPLMGLALMYVLERQVLLGSLSSELQGQALLAAEIAARWEDAWTDPARAHDLVTLIHSRVEARVVLLDSGGRLLASSDLADVEQASQLSELAGFDDTVAGLDEALAGQVSVHTTYSRRAQREVVDALVPVLDAEGQVLGIVRLSHQLTTVYERFARLRYLIAGVLAAGLLLGAGVGWVLALDLERPLRQLTRAVDELTRGERAVLVVERGPTEIQGLGHSVSALVQQLRDMEQARRKLLANLVHELGRPLGALSSAIQALLGGADRDEALRRELLTGIEGETHRLRRLLDDLAGLHDQVLGTLELDQRPIDTDRWLATLLGPWREAAQEKGLHWQSTIAPDLPALKADPDRLGQALGNLLSNAIKYTPPGGRVSIEAGVKDDEIWIRVSDTGPGIAADEQEQVFMPFYRSQAGRRFPQGMGLGLSIAREVILAHGGRLALESTPGLGSHFTAFLPLSS